MQPSEATVKVFDLQFAAMLMLGLAVFNLKFKEGVHLQFCSLSFFFHHAIAREGWMLTSAFSTSEHFTADVGIIYISIVVRRIVV